MSKIAKENSHRLEVLYTQSHNWLSSVAYNISKDKDVADDLVGELYLYLAEKCNPSIWYNNSFNLMYCHAFIKSRFLNRLKASKKNVSLHDNYDEVDTEYDVEFDAKLEACYDDVVGELKSMEQTRMWASSKLAQMYLFNDDMTLDKLAKEIHISKSTAFLNVKKAKKHIKDKLQNPFR
jgi:DNA-directed RNA polymerase specialized sigma24 family protein